MSTPSTPSTPTKRNSLLALGMLLLVVLVGAYFLGLFEPASVPAAEQNPANGAAAAAADLADLDPAAVVQRFYDDWLEYGRYTGNPLANQYYQESGYFTPAGIARLEAEKGPYGWLADPVLCAQDLPESVTVESATVESNHGSVLAVTTWDTRLGVDLVQLDGVWLIESITCLK